MAISTDSAESPAESLANLLSDCLLENVKLNYYHISTSPTRCTPLFAPPPQPLSTADPPPAQSKAQRTYCESHSLLLTVTHHDNEDDNDDADADAAADAAAASAPQADDVSPAEVAVFAIEVQIYSTATLTTVFVSKADSTGWISLLPKQPPRNPSSPSSSILRSIASTFVSWIIRQRHRSDRPLVLSLFARAQNQYLFPGSINNGKKHVLDDRGLVKWWCKTLDPIVREYDAPPPSKLDLTSPKSESDPSGSSVRSKAHLIVPGHDAYETQSFYPPSARLDPPAHKRWFNAHPLRQIAPFPNAPPRCLVPHFPDDPKTRFLLELDDELANAPQPNRSASSLKHESPTKRGKGEWRSVRTLEQFWDMMAFRQECSSGRLVGFIWVLFTPTSPPPEQDTNNANSSKPASSPASASPSPSRNTSPKTAKNSKQTPKKPSSKHTPKRAKRSTFRTSRLGKSSKPSYKKKKKLKGPIPLRIPRVKSFSLNDTAQAGPTTTKYFHSPLSSRGTLLLSDKSYNRMHELFLRLDFKNLQASKASTRRWIRETSVVGIPNGALPQNSSLQTAGDAGWKGKVVGRRKEQQSTAPASAGNDTAPSAEAGVTMLSVKRKRKDLDADAQPVASADGLSSVSAVDSTAKANGASAAGTEPNVLGAGLVRKKPKLDGGDDKNGAVEVAVASVVDEPAPQAEGVNILGVGLVRKKPKT